MIDLHTHTIFSDGDLIPAELAQRAYAAGYKTLAITDHADQSNLDFILPRIVNVCSKITEKGLILVLPGIELTHVDPQDIALLTGEARRLGAKIVVVHGETIIEPVQPGTNLAAIKAGVDILAHPGILTDDEAKLAAAGDVCLEITTRRGHSYTNGHTAFLARKHQVKLVLNNDAHAPGDFVSSITANNIALGAGLTPEEIKSMAENAHKIVQRVIRA